MRVSDIEIASDREHEIESASDIEIASDREHEIEPDRCVLTEAV